MADLIDYGQVRNAARDAASDVKGDVGRLGNDLQSILQQLNQHSTHLSALRTQGNQISDLNQRVNLLKDQLTGLTAKVDQLTNMVQNLVSRLPS
jgi:predicted  nucleic acid-binding Zn-ribbon protein